jgi:hypothetical protein
MKYLSMSGVLGLQGGTKCPILLMTIGNKRIIARNSRHLRSHPMSI